MRKSILGYFMTVLMTALLLCSLFFYQAMDHVILSITKKDMQILMSQVHQDITHQGWQYLKETWQQDDIRLTIFDLSGDILMDSIYDPSDIVEEDCQEVQHALKLGQGYTQRYSASMEQTMLYFTYYDQDLSIVVRLGLPRLTLRNYHWQLVPSVLLSGAMALAIAWILSRRFARSISQPLNEIADEMIKLEQHVYDLDFKTYSYEELQRITQATRSLSQSLASYIAQLEREKKIRQTFFANASHELKTPLTSIQGYAELLENGLLEDESLRKEALQHLKKETKNMSHLIRDILMISQLEAKDVKVTLEDIGCYLFLKETVDDFQTLAHQHRVTLHWQCEQSIHVWMSRDHLRSLVHNLLANAIKYNHEEGNVYMDAYVKDQSFILSIEDDGLGIPLKDQSHIFERFYRVDKGRSKKVGGTGLGLSIVKHIVHYYNGTIHLTSEENIGTKMTVILPVIQKGDDIS